MAEGRRRKTNSKSRQAGSAAHDLTSDDAIGYAAEHMNVGGVDPIERVAQVYQFLRSAQVEQTIRRFVASRKVRQLISAGLSVLEIVVVLLPLVKKLGGRVSDVATLVRQSSHPRRSSSTRTRAGRSLAAHSSVH